MADYYTQGTVTPLLPLNDHTVAALNLNIEDLIYIEDEDRYCGRSVAEAILADWVATWDGEVDEFPFVSFSVEDVDGKTYLYFDERFGDFEIHVLQEILKDVPEDIPFIVVEYANTCSRMRQDGFGGGALIITRDKIHRMNTSQWIDETLGRIKKAKGEK